MLVLDFDRLVAIARNNDEQSPGPSLPVEIPGRDDGRLSDWDMAKACEEAMGPNGIGLVAVRGMKTYASLRKRLLHLAHKLALMPNSERDTILKEHGLGTDVPLKDPGRPVSSFAAQLRFERSSELNKIGPTSMGEFSCLKTSWSSDGHTSSDLESLFKQLGMCMVEVGLLIARLCDATSSRGSSCDRSLEQLILESGSAKGRLIHYHSLLEQEMLSSLHKNLRKGHKQSKSANRGKKSRTSNQAIGSGDSVSTQWQQWHCDYGIFTILTAPLFLRPTGVVSSVTGDEHRGCCLENSPINHGLHRGTNHTQADQISDWLPRTPSSSQYTKAEREENSRWPNSQLLSSPHDLDLKSTVQECAPPEEHSCLLVMDSHGRTTSLVVPSDYAVVQVGEAAQLLSGGRLVARAHCVMRPTAAGDVSRDTMAVFLQPAWDRRMSLPSGIPLERALEAGGIATLLESRIPLLASRWREGCTFAEFSKETTGQYYGAGRSPNEGIASCEEKIDI